MTDSVTGGVTRLLAVAGAGGGGRTTIAAATALTAARSGARVLLLGADGTRDLVTLLGPDPGPDDEPGLTVRCVAVREEFEETVLEAQTHAAPLLTFAGVEPLEAEEITPAPGAAELLALRALAEATSTQAWDLVVADLPAGASAVRLLALPDVLGRYLDRLLPVERQAARALRPLLAAFAGVPIPDDRVFEAARRLGGRLAALRDVLRGPGTSVRVVGRPDEPAAGAARQLAASLALHGLRVEDVVVNGLVPQGSADPWLAERAAVQRDAVDAYADLFADVALTEVPAGAGSALGPDALAALGGLLPALADEPAGRGVEVHEEDPYLVLVMPLPGADRRDLDLVRRGDELVVTVGGDRRPLALPSALRRCVIAGAALRDGELRVRFEPDPAVWMRS